MDASWRLPVSGSRESCWHVHGHVGPRGHGPEPNDVGHRRLRDKTRGGGGGGGRGGGGRSPSLFRNGLTMVSAPYQTAEHWSRSAINIDPASLSSWKGSSVVSKEEEWVRRASRAVLDARSSALSSLGILPQRRCLHPTAALWIVLNTKPAEETTDGNKWCFTVLVNAPPLLRLVFQDSPCAPQITRSFRVHRYGPLHLLAICTSCATPPRPVELWNLRVFVTIAMAAADSSPTSLPPRRSVVVQTRLCSWAAFLLLIPLLGSAATCLRCHVSLAPPSYEK